MDDSRSKLKYTHSENVFEVEDILINILVRLPVKSLLICKSVCKYWQSLISSLSFMQSHLLQSQQNPSYAIYLWPIFLGPWNHYIHLLIKTDGETTQSFPGFDGFYFDSVICSFNGLICCINRRICESTRHCILDIHICNPATGQALLLPSTPKLKHLPDKVGVSFGPTINEYKVFQFFDREKQLYECMVYSSITGSWKSIGTVAHIPFTANHVYINGIVYWFSKSKIDKGLVGHILAVDREEKFSTIRIPEEETIRPFLVNFEGLLCLVAVAENILDENKFDIWALQDSKESMWVKKWSDYIPIPKIKRVGHVAVRKNEILFSSLTQYLFYNMETKPWREFNWEPGFNKEPGYQFTFSLPMAYTESLLPCNGRISSNQGQEA